MYHPVLRLSLPPQERTNEQTNKQTNNSSFFLFIFSHLVSSSHFSHFFPIQTYSPDVSWAIIFHWTARISVSFPPSPAFVLSFSTAAYSFIPKTETVGSSETISPAYGNTRRHVSHGNLHIHTRENFKPHILFNTSWDNAYFWEVPVITNLCTFWDAIRCSPCQVYFVLRLEFVTDREA
jgi:hypothetical protein